MVQSATKITPIYGELKFITFLTNFIVDTNPGDLYTNLEPISKHMLDNMDPLDELNKYRKAYGNLKECISKGKAISTVFLLDGTCFKF